MGIEKFEDIQAWQNAREIVNSICDISSKHNFAQDSALRDQIRRATVSIMSNITEGFSRNSTKEFIRFLFIAKASAAEVQSQLYTAVDQGYIEQPKFDQLYDKLDHCSRQMSNLITYLKGAKDNFETQ